MAVVGKEVAEADTTVTLPAVNTGAEAGEVTTVVGAKETIIVVVVVVEEATKR